MSFGSWIWFPIVAFKPRKSKLLFLNAKLIVDKLVSTCLACLSRKGWNVNEIVNAI